MAQRRSVPRLAMHSLIVLAVAVVAACSDGDTDASSETTEATETTTTTTAAPSGPLGPIVFQRLDPGKDFGDSDIYTVNPDGSDVRLLFRGPAEYASWSPDGTEVSVFCCEDGMAGHFVDVATGELRTVPMPDAEHELFCGFAWSPDGERVLCEGYGVDDPELNGMYSIRVSDGGGVERITFNPGGSDIAGGYSPDGKQIVFIRSQDEEPVGIFVVNVDGTGLRQLTPPDMILDDSGFGGRWSPNGDQIVFVAFPAEGNHKAIWIVDAEGGTPEQLPISPACGGPKSSGEFGCYSPSWSPDGEQIVFTRNDARNDDSGESIYIVNADGTGLVQVTDGKDDLPEWGTPAS